MQADGEPDLFDLAKNRKFAIREASFDEVVEVVCEVCGVDAGRIRQQKRGLVGNHVDKQMRWAKNIIVLILRDCFRVKMTAIAADFALADHSTIFYRYKTAAKMMKENREFRAVLIKCLRKFGEKEPGPQNNFHDIATHFLIYHHQTMPKALVFELNRIDEWLRPHGYKLGIKELKK